MPTVVHPYRPVGPVLVRASTTSGTVDGPPPAGTVLDELAWLASRWARPELRDAVALASPDLAGRIRQLLTDGAPSPRAVHRAVAATASSLTRWQRRATPFGLFAGVTAVTVGPAGARIGDRHTAVARADADWLTRVVDRLEQDHGLRRTLTVVLARPAAGHLHPLHPAGAARAPGRQAALRAVATELMAAIVPAAAEPPLAVDVRLDATVSLPQRVLDEAARVAGVLLRMTAQPFGSQAWLDYHARFRARYGPGAVLPVRDLVADSGLGYPPGYLGAPRARPAWRMLTERDAYVLALV